MCVLSHSSYILIQVFEFELRSVLNSLERHMHTKVWIPSESSLGAWRLEMSLVITVVFWWVASCRFSQASVLYPFPQTPQLYLLALEALVAGCNKTIKMLAVWKYCLCVCVKMKRRTSGGLHHKGIIKQTTLIQPDQGVLLDQTYTDLSACLSDRRSEERPAVLKQIGQT